MDTDNYVPLTAREVAFALAISDCEEMTGEYIARDMLDGVVEFIPEEIEKLAAFKGVDAEYLTEFDPHFRRYADPVSEARKGIALNLINKGFGVLFLAEICGLTPDEIKRLMMTRSA